MSVICMYSTGLIPDTQAARDVDRCERLLEAPSAIAGQDPIVQLIAWLRDQRGFPSCAGQPPAAYIDVVRGQPPWASAVSAWREARRRQGRIEQIDKGTRFQYVVAGLVARGWDPYVSGEDSDPVEAGLGAPPAGDDLADELFADDKRMGPELERYRILVDVLDAVDAALLTDLGVLIGTGTRPAYHAYRGAPSRPDPILGTEHLGGDRDGHGQRVFGRAYRDGRRIYLVQNSWGPEGAIVCDPADAPGGWGGCHLPNGRWAPGCCWVDESVVLQSWDLHVLEAKT